MELSFIDVAGLKLVTLLKNESLYIESLSAVILEIHLLMNTSKQRHKSTTFCMLAFILLLCSK